MCSQRLLLVIVDAPMSTSARMRSLRVAGDREGMFIWVTWVRSCADDAISSILRYTTSVVWRQMRKRRAPRAQIGVGEQQHDGVARQSLLARPQVEYGKHFLHDQLGEEACDFLITKMFPIKVK